MKKDIFITTGLLILGGMVSAQEKKTFFKFSSINSIGFFKGQLPTTFTMQSINGIKYKTWFAGAGVGLDTYGYQSIPVFADIRKTFGNKPWQLFVYGDAGMNYPIYSPAFPRKQVTMMYTGLVILFMEKQELDSEKRSILKQQFFYRRPLVISISGTSN